MYLIATNQKPDVRLTSFPGFVQVLGSQWPRFFAHRSAYDPEMATMRLQQHFRLTPDECIQLYVDMALHFVIPVCAFTYYKVAWADITVPELHAQLWHEANQVCPYVHHPYPTQKELLPHPI